MRKIKNINEDFIKKARYQENEKDLVNTAKDLTMIDSAIHTINACFDKYKEYANAKNIDSIQSEDLLCLPDLEGHDNTYTFIVEMDEDNQTNFIPEKDVFLTLEVSLVKGVSNKLYANVMFVSYDAAFDKTIEIQAFVPRNIDETTKTKEAFHDLFDILGKASHSSRAKYNNFGWREQKITNPLFWFEVDENFENRLDNMMDFFIKKTTAMKSQRIYNNQLNNIREKKADFVLESKSSSSDNLKTNELFEGINLKGSTLKEIRNNKALYEYIVDSASKANYLNEGVDDHIDEGILTGLIGAAAGGLIGPTIGKALCKILGINEYGTLGKLLTSPLVTTAIGAELGY